MSAILWYWKSYPSKYANASETDALSLSVSQNMFNQSFVLVKVSQFGPIALRHILPWMLFALLFLFGDEFCVFNSSLLFIKLLLTIFFAFWLCSMANQKFLLRHFRYVNFVFVTSFQIYFCLAHPMFSITDDVSYCHCKYYFCIRT